MHYLSTIFLLSQGEEHVERLLGTIDNHEIGDHISSNNEGQVDDTHNENDLSQK